VVLVGTRKDSETYVRSKKKSSAEVGFQSFGTELPESVSEEDLLKVRQCRGEFEQGATGAGEALGAATSAGLNIHLSLLAFNVV
jgi:hypothetical protein